MENIQLSFDTVTAALQWLQNKGYTHDFNTWLLGPVEGRSLWPEDFLIDYTFRFEGDSDPDNEDIVYGISSDRLEIKGVLTSAFGAYADEVTQGVIAKLKVRAL